MTLEEDILTKMKGTLKSLKDVNYEQFFNFFFLLIFKHKKAGDTFYYVSKTSNLATTVKDFQENSYYVLLDISKNTYRIILDSENIKVNQLIWYDKYFDFNFFKI